MVLNLENQEYIEHKDYKEVFEGDISEKVTEETVVMVFSFNEELMRDIICNRLGLTSILLLECLLKSPAEKLFEFYNQTVFYNFVLNSTNKHNEYISYRMIQKGKLLLVFTDENQHEDYSLKDYIIKTYKFRRVRASRRDGSENLDGVLLSPTSQRVKNIKMRLDYVLFELLEEGLQRIETLINNVFSQETS